MFIKSLHIALISFFLCAAAAWAGPASIQGVVKDPKGKPVKGADVRIESKDGKKLFNTVKTDTKGHYVAQGLPAGVYRVSLVMNGAVKAAISNTTAKPDQATQLNFDLQPVTTAQAAAGQKKATHKVWVPAGTGTHVGGRWVEEPDGASGAGTLNVKRVSAEELQREQLTRGIPNTGN